MLFEDTKYIDYKFPEPQYLGAKYIHRCWIARHVTDEVVNVFDAFAGSHSVAYTFKQLGKRVISNDFLMFNAQIGKALIENKTFTLNHEDVKLLFSPNSDPEYFNLIKALYSNLFFFPEEADVIDAFRSNVSRLGNPYKEALALTVMCRSLTRKVTMGHFAHTRALEYASDSERIKRNRSLARPLKDIFMDLLSEYNAAVFDNGFEHQSYCENTLDLLPKLADIDLVYFDPPYCNSHADYQSFYHLLETFVMYWKDKSFVNGVKRYEPQKYSGFDKKKDVLGNFYTLFENANHIPIWLLSYNDRSYPDIKTLMDMIKPFRQVTVEQKNM